MHLLLLASHAPSLGNFRGPLIADLVAAGHRVSAAAPDFTPTLQAGIRALGAEPWTIGLERTGTSIRADLRYRQALRQLIRRVNPDLVLTYTIKPNIWGALAANAEGVPSVSMVTGLGYAFSNHEVKAGLKLRLMRRMARWLYRRATNHNRRVIFQNPDDLRDFCAAGCLGDPGKAVLVNGSGVDLAHFQRVPLPEAPVFLMIARLLRSKGVAEYAGAAQLVRQRFPEARFLLLGPEDSSPDGLSDQEIAACSAGAVTWLGAAGDVRPTLAGARIYVLPSYREGTPRSVLEAMAMGRPVITSDAPGCRETVRDGDNGILVPPRDATALAAAMMRLLEEPALAARMGEASWQLAVEKYDVHRVNAAVIATLKEALNESGQS